MRNNKCYRERILNLFYESEDLLLIDARNEFRLSYLDAAKVIGNYYQFLKENGIKEGDRVAILLKNSPEFILLYLTCLLYRFTACPINPSYNEDEVKYCLQICNAKIVISDNFSEDLPIKSIHTSEFVIGSKNNFGEKKIRPDYKKDDIFTITFTSGSTGKPKAIAHRAETFLANANSFNIKTGNETSQVLLHVMPMHYMAGILNTIICPVEAGGCIVVDQSFGPLSAFTFWKKFTQFNCTTTWLSPTMVRAILNLDRGPILVKEMNINPELINIFAGTAHVSSALKKEFFKKYNLLLQQSYGLSETLIASVKTNSIKKENGSVGTLVDGTQVIISDEKEILLYTDYKMEGYLSENGEIILDDTPYFSTGDLGKIVGDELFITGRKKDLIIKGGENINPLEVEEIIQKVFSVKRAAVIGIHNEFYGEEIAAFIIPARGTNLEKLELDILKTCREKLSHSKVPSKILFRNSFPLTPTGKIRKSELTF